MQDVHAAAAVEVHVAQFDAQGVHALDELNWPTGQVGMQELPESTVEPTGHDVQVVSAEQVAQPPWHKVHA
jgi:hypothetical protein